MDELPSDEQLRRIEQRVMTRIRRRRQLPAQIASVTVVAGLFFGGVGLLASTGFGSAGSTAAGGGSAASAASEGETDGGAPAAATAAVRCYEGPSIEGPVVSATRPESPTRERVEAACIRALDAEAAVNGLPDGPTDAPERRLVLCVDDAGALSGFRVEQESQGVCAGNGLRDFAS